MLFEGVSRHRRFAERAPAAEPRSIANLRTGTKILDLRGFDPSRILMLSKGGILRPVGSFREMLRHQILGIILAGRLGAGL